MPSDGLSAVRLDADQVDQMLPSGQSASRLNPGSASTKKWDPSFGLSARDPNSMY